MQIKKNRFDLYFKAIKNANIIFILFNATYIFKIKLNKPCVLKIKLKDVTTLILPIKTNNNQNLLKIFLQILHFLIVAYKKSCITQ